MKKILWIFIFCLFCTFSINAAFSYEIKADAMTKRIPMGTKLDLEMVSTVTTETLSEGEMFSAYLTRDIKSGYYIVLPKGTVVRGNTARIIEPKILSRSAILYLTFDHIVAPNGKQIPLKAGLCAPFNLNDEGAIDGGGNYGSALRENWSKSGEIIKKSTQWGISSGEDLFKGGKYLVTPISAIGGTIAGAGYLVGDSIIDLFRKGKDVVIYKGEPFSIMLIEPLDVPVF